MRRVATAKWSLGDCTSRPARSASGAVDFQHRLDGLYDEPRPGAKRTITDEQVEQVIIRTLETTPRGATHWSTREMAKAVGLSHTAISRIWHTFGPQPHRSETFKLSNAFRAHLDAVQRVQTAVHCGIVVVEVSRPTIELARSWPER